MSAERFPVGSAVLVLVGQGGERSWAAGRVVDHFNGGLRASLEGTSFTVPVETHNVMGPPDATLRRRDWAVRVLDAWAQTQSGVPSPRKLINGKWGCLDFVGSTPEAARLAAAEAVWPELPESVRAELGERP